MITGIFLGVFAIIVIVILTYNLTQDGKQRTKQTRKLQEAESDFLGKCTTGVREDKRNRTTPLTNKQSKN